MRDAEVSLESTEPSLHCRIVIYTEILEVNLFAFAYRLFHEEFSPLDVAPFISVYKASH